MRKDEDSNRQNAGKVFDFTTYKKKKAEESDLARGRNPLYVSHRRGKIRSPHSKRPDAGDFGDRLQRIRTSLEKINKLMAELKRMSKEEEGIRRTESHGRK